MSPDQFPVRQPTDKSLTHGKVANPPRYEEAGGAYGAHIWFKDARPSEFAQAPQSNIARVEKPTSEKSGHKSARVND
jgi:hypothetical protein